MGRERILILGAAGRDFHDFNVLFRDRVEYDVVGFTASQIPNVSCRLYPPELSGCLYQKGIPIWPEEKLEEIIRDQSIDRCILAYSDLSNQDVMTIVSRVLAAGADFGFPGMSTMIESIRPVIAVCAVRTGAGKSPATRYIVKHIKSAGLRPVVVRHPMPYGNLIEERVQRFASFSDLDSANLTIEEREEYEIHIKNGTVVYAGVDYEAVLRRAEMEADVIVWDGGNNDLPFLRPDLWITIADALRPGHELTYYPGAVNFRAADIIVINKVNSASSEAIKLIEANSEKVNPKASVIKAASAVRAENPDLIRGKRVLVIEDGPTLTHGEMAYGAGAVAAEMYGASEIIDPRIFAAGSIRDVFDRYKHIANVLPAMGYYPEQIRELEETIDNADCDSVVIATPVDLRRILKIKKPSTAVYYEFVDSGKPLLSDNIAKFISKLRFNDRRRP